MRGDRGAAAELFSGAQRDIGLFRALGEERDVRRAFAQSGVSASFFFARSAWLLVITPASTISSIFLSMGICLSLALALRILWLDVGNATL